MRGLLWSNVGLATPRRGFAALALAPLQGRSHGPLRWMTAIARPASFSHPFDGLRLDLEVAKRDSLLAREQRDVIVGHAQLDGIAEERDPVRRIRCELLEGLEDPESLDGENGFRGAHVHEDARASVPR